MRTFTQNKFLLALLVVSASFTACYDDREFAAVPKDNFDYSYVEEFDSVSAALSRGWVLKNVSENKGSGIWSQGAFNDPNVTGFPAIPFAAYSSKGSFVGHIGVDYTSTTAAAATISNWLISPVTTMKNGDKISFYTRTYAAPYQLSASVIDTSDFANRLQVRLTKSDNLEVGQAEDPGTFTEVLLDINPMQVPYHAVANPAPSVTNPAWPVKSPLAYPLNWTKFEATVNGLNGTVKGRFAFRYFVTGAGSNGNATLVAVDKVTFTCAK